MQCCRCEKKTAQERKRRSGKHFGVETTIVLKFLMRSIEDVTSRRCEATLHTIIHRPSCNRDQQLSTVTDGGLKKQIEKIKI